MGDAAKAGSRLLLSDGDGEFEILIKRGWVTLRLFSKGFFAFDEFNSCGLVLRFTRFAFPLGYVRNVTYL